MVGHVLTRIRGSREEGKDQLKAVINYMIKDEERPRKDQKDIDTKNNIFILHSRT